MLTQNIHQAHAAIQQGGIVAYPTEAVYGLGCDPHNLAAVERLLAIKQRPASKGLILIAADIAQLEPWLAPIDAHIKTKILASWPGPYTWLLPANPEVSPLLRGEHSKLAVRVTAHPLAKQLCQVCGHALVSTSANRSTQTAARSAAAVAAEFPQELSCILDGPLGDSATPTSIRDALSDAVVRS